MPITRPPTSLPSFVGPKNSLSKQPPTPDSFAKAVVQIEQEQYTRQRSIARAEKKMAHIAHVPQSVLSDLKKHKIEKFHGIIEPYLKRSSPGQPLINAQDHRFISTTAERMIRRGELKRADKRDLEHVLKTLRATTHV